MSLLQQLRLNKLSNSNKYYHSIIRKNNEKRIADTVERDRLFDIEKIEEHKKNEDERVRVKNENLKRKMEMNKKDDVQQDKRVIPNTCLTSLISGFLTAPNKKKYIKKNRKPFKALEIHEQKTLFKLFATYI
jgi:hypothetical protein